MARKTRGRKRRVNPLTGFDASLDEQTALDQYLRDVSRHELITPDMEKILGARAQGTATKRLFRRWRRLTCAS